MRNVTVATTQMVCGWDIQQNIATATELVTKAAKAGANIILLQESCLKRLTSAKFMTLITLPLRPQLRVMRPSITSSSWLKT